MNRRLMGTLFVAAMVIGSVAWAATAAISGHIWGKPYTVKSALAEPWEGIAIIHLYDHVVKCEEMEKQGPGYSSAVKVNYAKGGMKFTDDGIVDLQGKPVDENCSNNCSVSFDWVKKNGLEGNTLKLSFESHYADTGTVELTDAPTKDRAKGHLKLDVKGSKGDALAGEIDFTYCAPPADE